MTVAGLSGIRHKSKPPALEALAACNWLATAWRRDEKEVRQPPSIAPPRAEQGGIVMTIVQPKARGEAVRAALLAIVRARYAAGLPLPSHRTMAMALGISPGQVTRHLAVLMDNGAFSTRCAGMHTRIELEEAA